MRTTYNLAGRDYDCAIQINGNTAVMSTFSRLLKVGDPVTIDGPWVVTGVAVSPYMKNVYNVSLRRVND